MFPDADLKIYITCDLDIRAGRRHQQQVAAGKDYTFDQVKQELASRDAIDRQHT
ncbi:cytidylate kinase, partial [bacterium]|nr:cytidylate kinase [bacterium]